MEFHIVHCLLVLSVEAQIAGQLALLFGVQLVIEFTLFFTAVTNVEYHTDHPKAQVGQYKQIKDAGIEPISQWIGRGSVARFNGGLAHGALAVAHLRHREERKKAQ